MRRLLFSLLLLLFLGTAEAFDLKSIETATPGDQYRQLSLMLLVSSGIDPRLMALLEPLGEPGPGDRVLAVDDYLTPLARIVDPQTMLSNAYAMIRFTRSNPEEFERRLKALAQEHPILVSMLDVNEMTADAIIIRNAIADSLDYTTQEQPGADEVVQQFRTQTLSLRNMLEYNQFQVELARITEQAITDLGGRLDAYQRMFNEEVDPDLVRRRIESAEIMNDQVDDRYEEQANARNAELLMMLILMESQVR
jgi:uncharacterized protein YjiS (DUF1127 family)